MAGISVSVNRGASGFKVNDFTIGTQTPNANDVELRFNTLDTNSKALTREDVVLALKAFERVVLSGKLWLTTPIL